MLNLAQQIKDKALEMGYEKCGIIKIGEMTGYGEELKRRMAAVAEGEEAYAPFVGFASPQDEYPWAKSVIVLATSFLNFKVPEEFKGIYSKSDMFDGRIDENSNAFKVRGQFGEFLQGLGIKAETEPRTGITAYRWAAKQAGIGIIRRNNFLYTEKSGSYVVMETWLIDQELEIKETPPDLRPCPEKCNLCVKNCPTGSLQEPYTMSKFTCASFLTRAAHNRDRADISTDVACKLGTLMYGCELCQSACPQNVKKFEGADNFLGLEEILPFMKPEKIMTMSYTEIGDKLAKYWYIGPEFLWKWKMNALTYMMNNYTESYKEFIDLGLTDEHEIVKKFATNVKEKLSI